MTATSPHVPTDFVELTEVSGAEVSQEQVDRLVHRYVWAGGYCAGRDVIEAACGTAQGAGYLAARARTLRAGDASGAILERARAHYGERLQLDQFRAEAMPYADGSADAVVLLEAIYYLESPDRFVSECRRILRPDGVVLVATANKDLYDFCPSPASHAYFGPPEFGRLFGAAGFTVRCFGAWPTGRLPLRQRVLRPVKRAVVGLGLMPRTASGKRWMKRLVFGSLVPMPSEVCADGQPYVPPVPVPNDAPDRVHKVIYCEATLPVHGR